MLGMFFSQSARTLPPVADNKVDTRYNLQPAIAPKVGGSALKLFTATIESGIGKTTIVPKLLKDNGFTKFKELIIPEGVTLLPIYPVASSSHEEEDPIKALNRALTKMEAPSEIASESFVFNSVEAYAAAYRKGDTTPLHVAKAILDACDGECSKLNMFIQQNRGDILKQAEESTKRFVSNTPISLLDGIPIAVKDEFHQAGYKSIVGTSYGMYETQASDSTVVARLRQAGALLIGKTVMSEIGLCPIGFQQHHGPPRNPYNPGHHTGGSSSGSAASVGCGVCPVAVSADGGGSIRIPAALCGMYGLKPTFARLSEHGAAPLCPSVGHAGPIAATARDLVLSYAAMQGADAHDVNSWIQPEETFANLGISIAGLKIGIDRRWAFDATPEIVDAVKQCLDVLSKAGAIVQDIEIPELDETRCAHALTILSEMANAVSAQYKTNPSSFSYDSRIKLLLAQTSSSVDYLQCQKMRTRSIHHLNKIFETVDVIITPSTGTTAPMVAEKCLPEGENDLATTTAIMRFAAIANFTGVPGISIPWSLDKKGLPIGIQFLGRPWDESTLLRLALHLEGQAPPRKQPIVHVDILSQAVALAEDDRAAGKTPDHITQY